MEITEKVAYLKGLAEGLGVDKDTKEGKLLNAIIDILEDMSYELSDLNDAADELYEGMDAVSDDLSDLEDYVFGDDDDDDCCCCDDDDDDCCCCDDDDDDYEFEVDCPACGENIVLHDSDLDLGEIQGPACGEKLEFEFD